jgi:hypothetical protein
MCVIDHPACGVPDPRPRPCGRSIQSVAQLSASLQSPAVRPDGIPAFRRQRGPRRVDGPLGADVAHLDARIRLPSHKLAGPHRPACACRRPRVCRPCGLQESGDLFDPGAGMFDWRPTSASLLIFAPANGYLRVLRGALLICTPLGCLQSRMPRGGGVQCGALCRCYFAAAPSQLRRRPWLGRGASSGGGRANG